MSQKEIMNIKQEIEDIKNRLTTAIQSLHQGKNHTGREGTVEEIMNLQTQFEILTTHLDEILRCEQEEKEIISDKDETNDEEENESIDLCFREDEFNEDTYALSPL